VRTGANMGEQNSRIDAKQAAKLIDSSARHIQQLIKRGTLSASRGKGNKYLIDKSEFYRVFPDLIPRTAASTREHVREQENNQLLFLKEQNEFLKEQLEHASTEKRSLLNALESAQRMIEFKPQKRRRLFGVF